MRPSSNRLSMCHAGLRVARGFTRGSATRLGGRFAASIVRAVSAEHFRCGHVRLRSTGADRRRSCPLARTDWPSRRSRPSTPPALSFDTDGAEGLITFAASGREAANSGLPCSSRPRTQGCPRSKNGCRRASATRAAAARRRATVRNVITARSRTPRGADPHLRLGARRRRRTRPLIPPEKESAMSTASPSLTPEQLEAFGQELDAVRARVVADLGQRDADYINKVIARSEDSRSRARAAVRGFLRRPGSAAPPHWPCRRSSTTWRSATTSCTDSTTG